MIPGVGNTPLTPTTPSTLSLPQGESDLFSTKLRQLPHLLARSLDLQRLKISRITRHIRLVREGSGQARRSCERVTSGWLHPRGRFWIQVDVVDVVDVPKGLGKK